MPAQVQPVETPRSRYPGTRWEYTTKVGAIGEQNIAEVMRAILSGTFTVLSHDVHSNGADIVILHNGRVVAKFEVFNENVHSYIDVGRARKIRKNLRGAKYKGLICSHGHMTKEAEKILRDIPILKLGFQTLPISFYEFYEETNQVYKRKIDSPRSFRLLKNLILSFFRRIGLFELMYTQYYYNNTRDNTDQIGKMSDVIEALREPLRIYGLYDSNLEVSERTVNNKMKHSSSHHPKGKWKL